MPTSLKRPSALTATAIFVAMAVACNDESTQSIALRRDSVGIRIIEHPVDIQLSRWSLSSEPETVIGRRGASDPAYQFTQVRGAVRLSDGRIVVGDWGSKEARYYDPNGRHLATVGGPGEGPGELRFLYSVDRVRGDTLVVGGWPIGFRYWFDENGGFIRNQRLGPWYPGRLGRTLVDGSLLLDSYPLGSYGNMVENWAARGPDEDLRPEGVVEVVSRDGSTSDTIGTIRGETFHKTGVLRQNFASHALPFTRVGLVAWSRDRIFIGHTEEAEVRAHAMDGTLTMIIRWVADTVPVTGADRDAFREEVLSGLRSPQLEPHYQRWLSDIAYPGVKPTFEALIADEDGYLWVRDPMPAGDSLAVWTVYGPDGVATATVHVPARIEVLDVDATHLVGKEVGDLDVESVVSYRVIRQESRKDESRTR